jgi:disulfide bond formation protein DsbB
MFVSLALTQPIIAAALIIAIGLATMHAWRWRSLMATRLYLEQCDVALSYPQFSNPEGQLDMRARTHKAGESAFEQYEWYVARLVYVLDECLSLMPFGRWTYVADTQLANHRQYFGSDYYAKQNYLPHYSRTMQRLIERQRKDA